jgi:hypothetical protein
VAALACRRQRLWRASNTALCLFFASASVLLAAPPPPSSQATQQAQAPARDYALIYGTVWGADDRPAAGIPITIRRSTDSKPKWKLVSDRRGEFAQRVPTGKDDYIVQADIKVPKGEPKPETTVKIDNNEREDVSLHLKSSIPASK